MPQTDLLAGRAGNHLLVEDRSYLVGVEGQILPVLKRCSPVEEDSLGCTGMDRMADGRGLEVEEKSIGCIGHEGPT